MAETILVGKERSDSVDVWISEKDPQATKKQRPSDRIGRRTKEEPLVIDRCPGYVQWRTVASTCTVSKSGLLSNSATTIYPVVRSSLATLM